VKGVDVWFKPLANDEWAMVALNRNKESTKFKFRWRHEEVKDELSSREIDFNGGIYSWQDLWDKSNSGTTRDDLLVTLKPHDVFMVKLKFDKEWKH